MLAGLPDEVAFEEESMALRKSSTSMLVTMLYCRDGKVKVKTHLAFAIGPKVHGNADKVVYGRVGGLVHERRGEGRQRQDDEAELEGAVDAGAGDKG